MFTDRVTIEFRAGKGGNGVVAWRREKYIPRVDLAAVMVEKVDLSSLKPIYKSLHLNLTVITVLLRPNNGLQGGPNNRIGKMDPTLS